VTNPNSIMKLFIAILFIASAAHAALPESEVNRIADAIYKIEGGAKTKHPYGVLSVKTTDPRRVCMNTIRNNWKRWEAAGRVGSYGDFLGNRYCPKSADPIGNRNWLANFKKLVGAIKEDK